MTARTTESLKLNKDALLPVLLSLLGFFLATAAWWLAWFSGLFTLIFWVVLMIVMDHVNDKNIVTYILLTVLVFAGIAAIAEFVVLANINNAASCFNDVEEGNDCKYLSPPLKMTIACVAMILWGAVLYLTLKCLCLHCAGSSTTSTKTQVQSLNSSVTSLEENADRTPGNNA